MVWISIGLCAVLLVIVFCMIGEIMSRAKDDRERIIYLECLIHDSDRTLVRFNDGLQYLFDNQIDIKQRIKAIEAATSAIERSVSSLEATDGSIERCVRWLITDVESLQEKLMTVTTTTETLDRLVKELRMIDEIWRREAEKIVRPKVFVRDQAIISQRKHIVGRRRHAVF